MLRLWFFTLLFSIQISVFVAGNDEQSENFLLRIQELDTAIDKEIQETNELLELMQVGEREERAAQACNSSVVVGFHAQLTTTSLSMSSGEVIKFNKVITNVGDGYNATTGVFTAPESGYYEFVVTIMAQSGNTFKSRVIVNGYNVYCFAYGSSRSQAQGMCNTIYYLPRGYTAKVVQSSGSALYGNGFSTFSGHLIA